MKILHLSFHVGCLNDIAYVFEKLGHELVSRRCELPFTITEDLAQSYWDAHESFFQEFDVILTSDTVAIAFVFLRQLSVLKPHLIILNCNRFDYAMTNIPSFYSALRQVHMAPNVSLIPYTQFEQIWCAQKGVYVTENVISPIGKMPAVPFVSPKVDSDFGRLHRSFAIKPDAETIFIQTYFNHMQFMDLPKYLISKDVSVVYGGYDGVAELTKYCGLVVLPDAFSKYFLFEAIQNEILTFVPSQTFLLELVGRPRYFFNIEGSGGRLSRDFVNLCEWYKYPESHIYFDSFEDLVSKIQNLTPAKIAECKKYMKFYASNLEKEGLMKWSNVLHKIMLRKESS
jgi:hypothetical protein